MTKSANSANLANFKSLFEADKKKTYKAYVGTHQSRTGLDMVDLESGEVANFKNVKDLIKTVQSNPRDYSAFYRSSSRDIRDEATLAGQHYADSVEAVVVRIEIYPSWAKSVGLKESADDVEYYGQLANQAKKDKKSKKETQKILKDAGCPSDIMADLTQRMK